MRAWEKILLTKSASIIDAMKTIESGGIQIALVVDENRKLLGSITDGDIRRGILKGINLQESVEKVMNPKPITAGLDSSESEVLNVMKAKKINCIPVLDPNGQICDLKILSDMVVVDSAKENAVVLMAGGLGSRLGELTATRPKPMLNVGRRPILEIILKNLISHGFQSFFISVNYKSEVIEEYFGNGEKWGVKIDYLREKQKMGTAGSLSLLTETKGLPFLVVNGDILTKVNFSSLLEQHQKNNWKATMCVRQYDFQVPFGVVKTNGDVISAIEEKPVHSFLVNGGVYVLNPECLKLIPKDKAYDMPQLFHDLLEKNMESGVFPVHEYWLDVGRRDDFERALSDYEEFE
jgi:dTDP-glucose pyrophosphorylase